MAPNVFTKSGYLNKCPKGPKWEEVLVYSKALERKQNKGTMRVFAN